MSIRIAQGRRQGFLPNGVPKLGMLDVPAAQISWPKLAEKLSTHTEAEDKASVKYIVGGYFRDKRRIDDNLVARTLLTLDFDHIDEFELVNVTDLGHAYVAHTTHSHTAEDGRWRVIVPLSREVADKRAFEILTRHVANQISIDAMDPASCKMNQFMWMPSCKEGAPRGVYAGEGEPLDVDAVLGQYDISDPFSWPHPEGGEPDDRPQLDRLGDPREKPGLVGAFCRVYSITEAIQQFDLPYEPAEGDRWRYIPDTDANAGAKIYDDDTHMFSHHTGDPAADKNHNAWDLVRAHLYHELDVGVVDTPIHALPSQKAMQSLAMKDKDVAEELRAWELEDFDDEPVEREAPGEQPAEREAPPAPDPVEPLEFDTLESRIEDRREPLNPHALTDLLIDVASARLSATEEDRLLGLAREACDDPKPTKKALQDTVKQFKRDARAGVGNAISDIEVELIERVLDKHYGKGRHLRRFAKQFWHYNRGLWSPIEDEDVRFVITKEIADLRTERPQDARALVNAVDETTTSGQAGALWLMFCAYIKGQDLCNPDPLSLNKSQVEPVINCLNGELHFKLDGTYELKGHNPDHFFTYQIPIEFDPQADTSDWDDFCGLLFHDSVDPEDNQRHIEEVGGYCLQPWREIPTFFLMRGEPAAGKSTFGSLVTELMGDSAAGINFGEMAEGRNVHADAELVGKLLALDDDFARGTALPDGFIKKVSEAKRVTVNPKYKDPFSAVLRSVPMLIANHWPPTRDHSGALERRAVVWNLKTIPVDKQDRKARDRLMTAGLPGVFLAFVRGFARLYDRQDWALPLDSKEALGVWLKHTDPVRLWVHEGLVKSADSRLLSTQAWDSFRAWYRLCYGGGTRLGRNHFYERLEHVIGLRKRSAKQGPYWPGYEAVEQLDDF